MAPPILSLALPSETGRVLSIQSHTVQVFVFYPRRESEVLIFVSCLVLEKIDCESERSEVRVETFMVKVLTFVLIYAYTELRLSMDSCVWF